MAFSERPVFCGVCDALGVFSVEYQQGAVVLHPATGWEHSENLGWICPTCVQSCYDAVDAGKVACVGGEPIRLNTLMFTSLN